MRQHSIHLSGIAGSAVDEIELAVGAAAAHAVGTARHETLESKRGRLGALQHGRVEAELEQQVLVRRHRFHLEHALPLVSVQKRFIRYLLSS